VLLLDEPASGLDPQARIDLRVLLRRLAAEGRTILISSHILHEVEQVCDKVVIINRGRLVAQGRTEDLRRELLPYIYTAAHTNAGTATIPTTRNECLILSWVIIAATTTDKSKKDFTRSNRKSCLNASA
jgi:ABC-type multidrug transport system ATPase subunit